MEVQRFSIDFSIVMRCWFLGNKRTSCHNESTVLFSPTVALFTTKSVPQKKRTQVEKLMYFYPLFTLNVQYVEIYFYVSSSGIRAQKAVFVISLFPSSHNFMKKNLFSYHGNALNITT